ncbi:lytic transglycosylase domain-containing protein [Paraburkholderia nemoris]|uniref:lytic transglycosylase domain-containing protein n=1 Tax=Paraburkholderia nemoris TaxID=2793076 RepID=UPI0038B8B707
MTRCKKTWLSAFLCFEGKRTCLLSKRTLPAAWLHRSLLASLIAGATSLPLSTVAAETATPPVRNTSNVIMMVGGLAATDDVVTPATPTDSAQPDAAGDNSKPLSVVIQPGLSQSTDPALRSSSSVASRVMALSPMIVEAARAADLDSALLMAVIDVESGGNPQAVSPKGATGLMQLMPGTGARHGASDLFDPRQNITAGARYLKQLMRQFGDLQLVLAAYNAGEGAVQKYGGQIPPYTETMSYVPKVIARYMRYHDAMSSTGTLTGQATVDSSRGRLFLVR